MTASSNEKPSRRAVAVHEAGHAVAAWALGLRIARLWIDDSGNGGTETTAEDHLPIVDQIAIHRAGQQATIMLAVEAPTHLAGRDRERVVALINRLHFEDQHRLLDGGRRRACDLLAVSRPLLVAVAEELEQAGSMDAAAFEKIVANSAR
jgi:peptidase M50B-like protein